MSERRKHPRIPAPTMMMARLVAGDVEVVGRVIDLNNAGAFVATDLELEPRGELSIELCLPGIDKVPLLKAIVARRAPAIEGERTKIPAGLGIVFQTTTVEERAFVQRAVLMALRSNLRSGRPKAG